MEIYPLSITQVDWQTFIKVCQSTLNFSPTRGIDESYLTLKDPAAFLACLGFDNKPLEHLRYPGQSFRHVSMSFIAVLNHQQLYELIKELQYVDLKILDKKIPEKDEYLVIMTATIKCWLEIIKDVHCNTVDDICNQIIGFFKQCGFKECLEK